jgi:serine/threonine protein phosphatase PrpC
MKSSKKDSDKGKDKEKKNKTRFLSPSFRKGVVKEKKEEEDDGEFKINLINADIEDDNEEAEESKGSSPKKQKDSKHSPKKDKDKEHHHHHHKITEDMKVNALPEGRVKKVSSYSQAGKGEDGFTKVNQDSFLVLQNQYNMKDFNIFSVMDGHGVNGHLVSRFVTKYFTSFFKNNKKMNSNKNEDEVYYRLKKNDSDILTRAFRHAERDIEKNSDIDANFSGTTCVMVLQVGEKILCANVGDSRAIMVKENNKIIPLSIDQKPDDPEETKRIVENGGEISQFEEDGEKSGPFRVWKKGEEYPGIAMSRSIGDFIATTLGVVPVPKFLDEKIDNDTKFIVVASDGVWEFLENQKVADIVMPFYKKNDPDGACKALIKESTDWWNQEDVVVDDITTIVVFF